MPRRVTRPRNPARPRGDPAFLRGSPAFSRGNPAPLLSDASPEAPVRRASKTTVFGRFCTIFIARRAPIRELKRIALRRAGKTPKRRLRSFPIRALRQPLALNIVQNQPKLWNPLALGSVFAASNRRPFEAPRQADHRAFRSRCTRQTVNLLATAHPRATQARKERQRQR